MDVINTILNQDYDVHNDDDDDADDENDDGSKSGGCEGWLGAAIDSQDGVVCQGRCLPLVQQFPFSKIYNFEKYCFSVFAACIR